MQPYPIRRNRRDRLVDRVDVQGDRVEEAVEAARPERSARAAIGQIGAVELEHESARDDQLVLLRILRGEARM